MTLICCFFRDGLAGTAAATSCPARRHSSAARSASSPGTRIQSVSKVESVNTLISAAASGASSSARTPVSAKSRGPSTSKAVNGRWCTDLVGTLRAAQTIEVSVAVAVTEKSEEDSAHVGHLGAGTEPDHGEGLGDSGSASRREPHGAEPGGLVEAEREVHALHGGAARCPWRGCRPRRRRPAGRRPRRRSPGGAPRCMPVTDLVCGHCPSGSRCTNGSSAYAFSYAARTSSAVDAVEQPRGAGGEDAARHRDQERA